MDNKQPDPPPLSKQDPASGDNQSGNSILVVQGGSDQEFGPGPLPFPVVGLGASAGGLDAYMQVLQTLPADTGMAFILVPHLAPAYESHFCRILSEYTSMPVEPARDGVRPEQNRVYFVPPGKRLTIASGVLRLHSQPSERRPVLTIDHFFRSLAADQKNHAIGVLLSGTDSDGALGLKAIRGEGGISIVQDPDSAEFASMPRSGILADHVDLVLPPDEIGRELGRLARRFFEPGETREGEEPHVTRILTLLRSVSGIEFRLYKPATIRRRIARRMMLQKFDSLSEYAAHLQENPVELHHLEEDLLVNVTRLFRDPETFEALETDILPRLFENRPVDQQVRIWIAACSTGEEAYSIAICLLEYLSSCPTEPPIQIFGTDASQESIERARAAVYPETISADISPDRLRRFFVKTEHGYQVSKRLRDLCIFACHNLCVDPPFSRLDLVSCRNVLIYLGPEIQRRIITMFHYALRPNGYLWLGNAESIREYGQLFVPIDRKHKFYAKAITGAPVIPSPVPRLSSGEAPTFGPSGGAREGLTGPELQRAADRIVLARYAPAGVIINDRMEVLQVRGHTAPYLQMTSGTPSLHLIRMAHPGIGPALLEAVRRAIDEDIPVVLENASVLIGDQRHGFRADILPIREVPGRKRTLLVVFVPTPLPQNFQPATTEGPSGETADELSSDVSKLRQDLASTRTYLQSLIEERDSRNQELTSAYEEMQSTNEELQSINEELETAKEELQSTNEELQTLNEELRNRNIALIHASSDLSNLLTSVNIPVVMLGNDLTIRQYTPPAERLMRIRSADVGRPITEIRLNLMIEEIEPLLQNVLDTLTLREIEVQDREGCWHLLRIRPYRTTDNKIDGLVLVLLDIDQIRRGEEAMREARDFSRSIVEAVPIPFVVLDHEFRVRDANSAFRELAAMKRYEIENRSFPELTQLLWSVNDLHARLEAIRDENPALDLEFEHEIPGQSYRVLRFVTRRVQNEGTQWLLVLVEDITEPRRTEQSLLAERDQLSGAVYTTTEALDRTKQELRALAGRLFISQEEERRHVARELHDDISQKLATLDMDAQQAEQNLTGNPEESRRCLDGLRQRLADLSHDVRAISHQLHPSVLDHLGLAAALKSLVDEFGRRENMPATFKGRKAQDPVPPEVACALFRIAQEALRNVAKHAGHTHVKVTLESTARALRLTIRDSGEGFDFDEIREGGLGLISMKERARLVGGDLSIHSELGEGTTVTVTVPLPDAKQD